MPRGFELIIFDFDGVVADSEVLANAVLAEAVTELGLPTPTEEALSRYVGKRFQDLAGMIAAETGRPLPQDFEATLEQRTLAMFEQALRPVPGVVEFIEALGDFPICIASSSSPRRLALSLSVLGLAERFGDAVFSAELVARGKPHPDIVLHAAALMGVDPGRALVIEDSPSGVRAGVAAGATVVGFLGASHIRPGHDEVLTDAGAHALATRFDEIARFLSRAPLRHTAETDEA